MPRGIVNRRDKFNWDNCHMPDGQSLPRVTPDDAGKILTVDENGKWSADESEVSKEITNANIAHFADAANAPLADLKVDIKAVQAGSGDPSPTNVRAITGFSEVKVVRTNANVWDEQWELGTISTTTGQPSSSSTVIRSKNAIKTHSGVKYRFIKPSGKQIFVLFYDINGNPLQYISKSGDASAYNLSANIRSTDVSVTFTTPSNTASMLFRVDETTTYTDGISINYPSTDTSYHAYNGTTYTVTMPAAEGYVYGGTLDVLTGKLTVTKCLYTFSGSESWSFSEIGQYWQCAMSGIIPDKYAKTGIAYSSNGIIFRIVNNYYARAYIGDNASLSGSSDMNAIMSDGIQTCYELATPIVYNLAPTEVYSLLGENNIFANSGDILSVSYVTREYAPITAMIEDVRTKVFEATLNNGSYKLDDATCDEVCKYARTHSNVVIKAKKSNSATYDIFILSDYIISSAVFRHTMITSSIGGSSDILYVRELQANSGDNTNSLGYRELNIQTS